MNNYEAIIFDLGGVLVSSPFEAVADVGREVGINADELVELIYGYGSESHPWHGCERAEISFEEYCVQTQALVTAAGHAVDPRQLFDNLELTNNEAMLERVRILRKEGYKTAILTNNIADFRDWWHEQLPVEELFDVVVDSHEVGMRKPDPAIFALTLAKLGNVDPARAVFLDDAVRNVQGAQRCGITAILVTDERSALDELDRLLDRQSRI